jgi:hypothetical protein
MAGHFQRGLSDLGYPGFPLLAVQAPSMSSGYNKIIQQCQTEYLILAHHDAWPLSLPTYFCGKRLLERMQNVDLLAFAGAAKAVGPRWFDSLSDSYGSVANYPPDPPNFVPTPDVVAVRASGMRPAGISCWNRCARLVRGIKVADGYAMVFRTEALKKHLFDERYPGYHFYDLDITLTFFYAGLRTAVCNDVYFSHNSTGSYIDPNWCAGIEPFLNKWRGRFDGTITGVGKGAYNFQTGDCRLALLELQREEKHMLEEFDAQSK